MGRTAKTDAEKALTGTLQPCRKSGRLAVILSAGKLDPDMPPTGLRQEAKNAWKAAIENAPDGFLSVTDASVLERWCRNWALYRSLARDVEDAGVEVETENGPKLSPRFLAMCKVESLILQCEKELGFTPCARARVRVPEPEPENKSPFDDL